MTLSGDASSLRVATDFDQAAGANGGNGLLTVADGATLRLVANEQRGDGANSRIHGGGSEGHIDVAGGGRPGVVDAGSGGDSSYHRLADSSRREGCGNG